MFSFVLLHTPYFLFSRLSFLSNVSIPCAHNMLRGVRSVHRSPLSKRFLDMTFDQGQQCSGVLRWTRFYLFFTTMFGSKAAFNSR